MANFGQRATLRYRILYFAVGPSEYATSVGVEVTGLAEEFFVGDLADGVGDRTVVNDRDLTTVAAMNMSIHAVVARVQLAPDKPAHTSPTSTMKRDNR